MCANITGGDAGCCLHLNGVNQNQSADIGAILAGLESIVCICACEQSTELSLLMAFLPYNHLILSAQTLPMSCMSASTPGARLHLTPQLSHVVSRHHTRISSFTLPAASVSPVGMVTRLSPSQVALAGPPTT